jgi:hypothetical protein
MEGARCSMMSAVNLVEKPEMIVPVPFGGLKKKVGLLSLLSNFSMLMIRVERWWDRTMWTYLSVGSISRLR